MKKILIAIGFSAILAFTACKGNSSTAAGDSTGTGAGGARVPGLTTKDTTKHDSASGNDSSKNAADTTRHNN